MSLHISAECFSFNSPLEYSFYSQNPYPALMGTKVHSNKKKNLRPHQPHLSIYNTPGGTHILIHAVEDTLHNQSSIE